MSLIDKCLPISLSMSLILSHTHTLAHSQTLPLFPPQMHTDTLTHTPTLSLKYAHTLTLSLTNTHTHTHTSPHTLTLTHIEEAMPVKHQNVALDYIGKRGSAVNVGRRERVQYAREILQKEVNKKGRKRSL